jgi:hypothetical protein
MLLLTAGSNSKRQGAMRRTVGVASDWLNDDLRKGGIESSDCSVDLEKPRVIE